MLSFRELNLDDKPGFDRMLAVLQPETSDLTFTNLFMWQHSYGLRVFYEPELDYWILFAKPPGWKLFFLPPIGDWADSAKLKQVLILLDRICKTENYPFLLRRIPKRLMTVLREIDPGLECREERNTFDYLYQSAGLIDLAGRKYHGKRNHLNQFLRKYSAEYRLITRESAVDCLNLETRLINSKGVPSESMADEWRAIAMVMNNYQALEVVGGMIVIDNAIQAIAVGEKLNDNTAVIHIEKANTEYEGIYAAINQQFAANQWADLELINREEDMGIEGLRKAKLSYHPVKMIEKYSVTRKSNPLKP